MASHILSRLALSIPVLFGVLLLGFGLLKLVPGDPAMVVAGPMAPPEVVARIRTEMGLDKPVAVQFGLYLVRVLQGDLGYSMISNTRVASELADAIGPTLELMLACLVWSIPLGIGLGTIAAAHRGRALDRIVIAISVLGVSTPIFFIGLLLMQWIGYRWELLPFLGRAGPLWTLEGLRHIALPALSLGLVFIGPVARMTRTAALEVFNADHVRTARAKGLKERTVILRHVLRNALIPVVTLIGLQAGYLLGGAVVTETIYSWPGVGRLAVGAILANDMPLAQGAILVLAVSFILINLVVDMLYAGLDPRVQRR
ncbi:ABC transporter permease [Salinarimonas soli]|uniref:ABC transporter permease n=1 Tax=Salinarimonas soli TaxID=1638099 RepID=A0A5B2VBK4_9HYPH|nr:ABC transporter permease [Salinarimonas soli]KAA2236873.1 ABC transporter permease [Salinarimonas soli]